MPNKRTDMVNIRQLIRLKSQQESHRYISQVLGISRTTVVEYVKQLNASGMDWRELLLLNDEGLALLFSSSMIEDARYKHLANFFPYMDKELRKTGVTRRHLWQEYQQQTKGKEESYSYSQFCYHYQQWSKKGQVTAPLIHKAGEKLFIDFTGKLLETIDRDTGEIIPMQVFVGVLAASGYTFVRATYSQKQQDFLDCLSACLRYFGGVPSLIMPDNLKSAVVKSSSYEPELTVAMKQWGLHYNTVILPVRSYKPKDKAAVENAVKQVYSHFFAPLRNEQFFSLAALNTALSEQLEIFNNKAYQHRDYSRRHLFEKTDQQYLQPLPAEDFCLKKQVRVMVQKNGHIWLSEDKHYYSVPYKFIGQRVQVYYTSQQVEIYSNFKRVALHHRNRKGYGYTTESSHLSSTHRYYLGWSPEKFKQWAAAIGTPTAALVDKIFETKPHPEQAYKSCQGILALARKVGNDRLNNACQRALHYQSYYYNTVKRILEKGLDLEKDHLQATSVLPDHENLRGSKYYR